MCVDYVAYGSNSISCLKVAFLDILNDVNVCACYKNENMHYN